MFVKFTAGGDYFLHSWHEHTAACRVQQDDVLFFNWANLEKHWQNKQFNMTPVWIAQKPK